MSNIKKIIFPWFLNGGGGVTYSPEATAVFNRMSGSVPSTYKTLIAAFIDAEVLAGNWDNIREFWFRGMNNQNNAQIGWMGVRNSGYFGALSRFNPGEGYDYDGLTDFSSLHFSPLNDGGAGVTLNNAAYGVFVVHSDNDGSLNTNVFGVQYDVLPTYRVGLGEVGPSNLIGARINQDTIFTDADDEVLDDDTIYIIRRTASNAIALLKGTTVLGTATTASTGLSRDDVYEGCNNTRLVPTAFFDGKVGASFVFNPTGFNYVSFVSELTTMCQGIQALPPIAVTNPLPSTHRIGFMVWGQSNAMTYLSGAPPAYLQALMSNVKVRTGADTWASYQYNVNNGDLGTAYANAGPDMALVFHAAKYYARDVYVAKVAVSGAGLFAGDVGQPDDGFSPSEAKDYPSLEASLLDLQEKIIADGFTPIIIQVIIQGERDTLNGTTAAAWDTNMNLIQTALSNAGVDTDYIIVAPLSGAQNIDPTNEATVIARQNAFIAAAPNRFALSLVNLPLQGDVLHYTAAGAIQIGYRAFDIVRDQIIL